MSAYVLSQMCIPWVVVVLVGLVTAGNSEKKIQHIVAKP